MEFEQDDTRSGGIITITNYLTAFSRPLKQVKVTELQASNLTATGNNMCFTICQTWRNIFNFIFSTKAESNDDLCTKLLTRRKQNSVH